MRNTIQWFLGALILNSGVLLADTTVQYYDAAATSFPSLAVPVGVRAIGMGGAFTAVGNDVYALNWNPAGISKISGYQVGLSDNQWAPALGLRQELVSYGQGLDQGTGIAGSVNYFSLGQLQRRDASGAVLGQTSSYLLAGTLGYGKSLLKQQNLMLGVALEFAQQNLFDASLNEIDAGLGTLYEPNHHFAVGLSLNHLGTNVQGFSSPASLNAGLAWFAFERRLTLAFDSQLQDKTDPLLKAGLEIKISSLSFRFGYRQVLASKLGDVQSGLTAGAGFKVGVLLLDYAFVTYGDLGNVHRMGITVDLPRNFFQPTVVGAEGTVEMAKAYFDKAVDLENSGDTLKALIEYQRSEETYPEKLKSAPEKFYLTAQEKVIALQTEMNKQGDGGQVKSLVKEYLAKAQENMKAQHFREAGEILLQAQKIDPGNPVVASQLLEARAGLDKNLLVYRSAARAADQDKKLNVAVQNYKRLLVLDPSDKEAVAYLTFHRKEIESMLQDIHRTGIYEYVAGRLDKAIDVWAEGEALDYFGDVGFRRDIDKAKKRLGLHNDK